MKWSVLREVISVMGRGLRSDWVYLFPFLPAFLLNWQTPLIQVGSSTSVFCTWWSSTFLCERHSLLFFHAMIFILEWYFCMFFCQLHSEFGLTLFVAVFCRYCSREKANREAALHWYVLVLIWRNLLIMKVRFVLRLGKPADKCGYELSPVGQQVWQNSDSWPKRNGWSIHCDSRGKCGRQACCLLRERSFTFLCFRMWNGHVCFVGDSAVFSCKASNCSKRISFIAKAELQTRPDQFDQVIIRTLMLDFVPDIENRTIVTPRSQFFHWNFPVGLGRARRSRDGLMESCTCRRRRPPQPPPTQADTPSSWPPTGWAPCLALHCHMTVSRDHVMEDGRARGVLVVNVKRNTHLSITRSGIHCRLKQIWLVGLAFAIPTGVLGVWPSVITLMFADEGVSQVQFYSLAAVMYQTKSLPSWILTWPTFGVHQNVNGPEWSFSLHHFHTEYLNVSFSETYMSHNYPPLYWM